MKKLLSAALVVGLLLGCTTQRFVLQSAPDTNETAVQHTFWVGGIGQKKEVDAATVCGGAHKVAAIETQDTGKTVLLTLVTLGIYSPREMRISCTK